MLRQTEYRESRKQSNIKPRNFDSFNYESRKTVPAINYTPDNPIRMYLRDMESLPLLTKQGEVEIAKKMESGKETISKIIFTAPFALNQIFAYPGQLKTKQISMCNICIIQNI